MKKLKVVLKRILITYLILYIILASMSTCFARGYDSACGEYLAKYAIDFINTYGQNSRYGGKGHNKGQAEANVDWDGGAFGQGTFWCCCTSGVWYMYQQALNVDITQYGFSYGASNNLTPNTQYWEKLSISQSQPGDIIVKSGHVEMATTAGATAHANFGSYNSQYPDNPSCNIHDPAGDSFECAIRLKNTIEVDPSGKVTGTGISSGTEINYSKFFFNGIPDGTYSVASRKNIFETIIDALANILNYLIGILTYIFRLAAIGWIALADRLLNNTVNSITNPNIPAEETIAPAEVINLEKDERHVTIETLLYNQLDIFNVNVFE